MFFESPRFPTEISQGSSGGPMWNTEIVVVESGYEFRNQRWKNARHEFNVAYGVRSLRHLESLKEFFMNVRGQVHAFRYKDWGDCRSCRLDDLITPFDQYIATGDGIVQTFQLIKNYDIGLPYVRKINKPVMDTVRVSVDGSQVTPNMIDHTTGLFTLDVIPPAGVDIKAGFEFDVPCRFSSDSLSTNLGAYETGSAQMQVTEIRIQ